MPGKTREEFGFEPDAHIYLCPQTLFKFHPDFDPLLGAVLDGDPAGTLVLIEGKHKEWQELLMARLQSSIEEAGERVRPKEPVPGKTREEFGFEPDAHIYLCPQTLFKFHPDFDPLLGAVLDGDPAGTLVLIEGKHKEWQELLMARLQSSIEEAGERVRFVPRQGFDDYLSLLSCADVILDPPIFGGGNSTLEALAMGTPVVTLPDKYLRARISYTWYRKMEVMDCVAKDSKDYVRIALDQHQRSGRCA